MLATLLAFAVSISGSALGQVEPPNASYEQPSPRRHGPPADVEQRAAQVQKQLAERMADALGLGEDGRQTVRSILASFEPQQRALRGQLNATFRIIQAAATGEPGAVVKLDGAISEGMGARYQLMKIQQDIFNKIVERFGLNGQQKAKLLIAMFSRGEHGG